MGEKFSLLQKIKEHPVHSLGQLIKIVLIAIMSALWFIFGVLAPILMLIYIAGVVVLAVIKWDNIASLWWVFLAAALGGCLVIKLVCFILSGLFAKLRQDLLVSAFGVTAEENQGGNVPMSCSSSFNPVESELLELERKFNANLITAEEYEGQKQYITKNTEK